MVLPDELIQVVERNVFGLLRHGESMRRLWQRARNDVALPKAYSASISLGVAPSLWDQLELKTLD